VATYTIRPDGTVAAGWTINGGAASTDATIGKVVTQPTVPSTATWINATPSPGGQVAEVSLGSLTLSSESVTSVVLWAYDGADNLSGASAAAQLYTGSTAKGSQVTIADNSANAWQSATYTGALTQSELDDLRIRFTNGGSGGVAGSKRVYAAYAIITTAPAQPNLTPSAAAAATASVAPTVAQGVSPSSSASSTTSLSMSTPAQVVPTVAGTAAVSGSAEVGLLPKWKAALRKYKAGLARVSVIAFGDSLTEGYFAGSGLRTSDGYPARTGLNLSRHGDPSIHPGVYYPTTWSTANNVPAGSDPSGSDPWTRTGTVNSTQNSRGNADKTCVIFNTGGSLSIPAPTWATHALVHYSDNGGGSGDSWTAASNSQVVLSHLMDSSTTEQAVLVPLVGSGNTFKLTQVGGGGNGNPAFNGVTFQQRRNVPITSMTALNASNVLGGTSSVSLTGVATGALMVVLAGYDAAGTAGIPALPSGWTSHGATTVGSHSYRLCSRVKQSGDTSVSFAPSSGASDVSLAAYNGAAVGQVASPVTGTAAATTITPPAVDFASRASWSLLAVGAGQSGASFTFPTGWSKVVSQSANTGVAFGVDPVVPYDGARLTPGAVTLTSAVDRIAWQIELVQAASPVTESFLQVLDNGHGGYQAHTYANPSAGAAPPASQDTSFYWASAAGLVDPDLWVVYLG
jgi:hypothetical protein